MRHDEIVVGFFIISFVKFVIQLRIKKWEFEMTVFEVWPLSGHQLFDSFRFDRSGSQSSLVVALK